MSDKRFSRSADPLSAMSHGFERDARTLLCYTLLVVLTLTNLMLGPLLPWLKAGLGLSYLQVSLHSSALAVGMCCAGMLGEVTVRRFGRARTIVIAFCGMSCGLMTVCLAPMLFVSLPGCLLMGVSGGLILAIVPAVMVEIHGDAVGIAYGEANVIAYIGVLFAPFAVQAAVFMGSWRFSFVFLMLSCVVIHFVYRPVRLPEIRSGKALSAHHLPRAYWSFWSLLLLSVAAEFSTSIWAPSFLETEVGLSRAAAVWASMAFPLGIIAGRCIGIPLVRRFRPEQLIVPTFGVAMIGFFVFWLGNSPIISVAGLFLTGAGLANQYPLGITLAMRAAGEATDKAAARSSLASGGAMLLVPITLGMLADQVGLASAFALLPLLIACAGGVTLNGLRLMRQYPLKQ